MRIILLYTLSLLTFSFAGSIYLRAADVNASAGDLNQYFQSIFVDSSNFIFVRKKNGPRMSIKIGNQYGKLCDPGETIKVPRGTSFILFEKHSGINFDALGGIMQIRGFLVTKYSDTRSVGGELQKKKAVVLIGSGSDPAAIKIFPFDSLEAQRLLGTGN
jgi:hypothetical protein